MNFFGWEKLLCEYFKVVSREALRLYFKQNGFFEIDHPEQRGIVFNSENTFLEISYDPETFPKYRITMIIGYSTNGVSDNWRTNAIPLWAIVPNEMPAGELIRTCFSSEKDLHQILSQMTTEVFDPYLKPFLLNSKLLSKRIIEFNSTT